MVIPAVQIGYDIAGIVTYYALAPFLWVVLFLVAWEDRAFARSIGFGPRTFWFLVPGVALALLAELPFAQIDGSYLGINIGGGLIPLVLSCLLFARFAPPRARTLPAFLVLFGAECAAALAVVLFVSAPGLQDAGVAAVAVLATVAAILLPARLGFDRAIAALVGATSGVLTVTFLITASIPQVGITAPFPAYLVAPIAAGVVLAILGYYLFGDANAGRSIPLAYVAGTLGVIMGADLLRQPPLYGVGAAGFYVIGGGNLLDLVYLSGLLAFAAAYLSYRSSGLRRQPIETSEPSEEPAPAHVLSEAIRLLGSGAISESIDRSSAAARAAALESHELRGTAPAPPERPWEGLPVAGWVVADQANLDALAKEGSADPREAERAAQTARRLVGVGRSLIASRFASLRSRIVAFVIDLVVVTLPAALIWLALIDGVPASANPLNNLSLVTAAYGFIAIAFLYFVVFDILVGTTVGKYAVGIEVRERRAGAPGLLPSMLRELPKLVDLTTIGILGPAVVVAALGRTVSVLGFTASGPLAAIALLLTIGIPILVAGVVSVVAIGLSYERQRIGDWMASTFVTRRSSAPELSPTAAAPSSGASGS